MKKILVWMLLLAVLATAGCSNTTDPSTNGNSDPGNSQDDQEATGVDYSKFATSVRLLCYNIYYKDVDSRAANISDLILKQNPDVLMLQEVSVSWIPYLQSFMADNGYSYYGYGRYGGEMSADDLQSGDQFVPILWKTEKYDLVESGHFWLSSTPEIFSSDWLDGTTSGYPRCVNWVILKDKQTGGEFLALNIHTDPEVEKVRTNSCALTVEKLNELRDGRPALLGGDWNMGLNAPGYEIVTTAGYNDLRIIAEERDLGGSFNAWGEREEGNFAYGDHLFASEGVAASVFDVVDDVYDGDHISDHNPLLAVLYFN